MRTFSTWLENKGEDDKIYHANIEEETIENEEFRKVVFTNKFQLVYMTLKPGEDIGEEVHEVDQFFRIESGNGKSIIDDKEYELKPDFAIIVPAGSKHNFINTGEDELKLYTIYSSPQH